MDYIASTPARNYAAAILGHYSEALAAQEIDGVQEAVGYITSPEYGSRNTVNPLPALIGRIGRMGGLLTDIAHSVLLVLTDMDPVGRVEKEVGRV